MGGGLAQLGLELAAVGRVAHVEHEAADGRVVHAVGGDDVEVAVATAAVGQAKREVARVIRAFGGEIGSAQRLLHGKTSLVEHDGRGVFRGLPQGLEVGRYHSLAATRVPDELEVTARSDDGEVMGVRHRGLPIEGVQFHPESVLTPLGKDLLRNFIGG